MSDAAPAVSPKAEQPESEQPVVDDENKAEEDADVRGKAETAAC